MKGTHNLHVEQINVAWQISIEILYISFIQKFCATCPCPCFICQMSEYCRAAESGEEWGGKSECWSVEDIVSAAHLVYTDEEHYATFQQNGEPFQVISDLWVTMMCAKARMNRVHMIWVMAIFPGLSCLQPRITLSGRMWRFGSLLACFSCVFQFWVVWLAVLSALP